MVFGFCVELGLNVLIASRISLQVQHNHTGVMLAG